MVKVYDLTSLSQLPDLKTRKVNARYLKDLSQIKKLRSMEHLYFYELHSEEDLDIIEDMVTFKSLSKLHP